MSAATHAEEAVKAWLCALAGLGAETTLEVREEPHCPDPGCPLRHTLLQWTEAGGGERRLVVVKPLAYVRQADVARAWRQANLGR